MCGFFLFFFLVSFKAGLILLRLYPAVQVHYQTATPTPLQQHLRKFTLHRFNILQRKTGSKPVLTTNILALLDLQIPLGSNWQLCLRGAGTIGSLDSHYNSLKPPESRGNTMESVGNETEDSQNKVCFTHLHQIKFMLQFQYCLYNDQNLSALFISFK